MAAQRKSWVRGRLYIGTTDTGAASPLTEAIDFNYDYGQQSEEMPFAGASVTPSCVLLSKPTLAINFNRRADGTLIAAAVRNVRDNGYDVRWYLYLDITGEAAVYAYGFGIPTLSLQGGAAAGMKGAFTLTPGDTAVWDDHFLVA